MPYDKRYKRFKEFTEDMGTRPMGMAVRPNDYQKCPECGGDGKSGGTTGWGQRRPAGRCTKCQGTGYVSRHDDDRYWGQYGEEMSAGGGAVAGIGQPPGSAFGEHPQQAFALGGATTKTKKKNKKATVEGFGDWAKGKSLSDRDAKAVLANAKAALSVWPEKDLPALKRLIADAERGSSGVIRLRQFLRDNGVVYEWDQTPDPVEGGEKLTEVTDDEVEKAAKAVHDQWVANQKKDGKTEHKSPDGKEDYMVPYDKLKEKSKDMDRDAVKATLGALGLDEERETFAGAPVFEVDTDKWMKSRFGKNRYHRYSRYVGEDEKGEEIRQHGRSQRKDDIILKDQTTGAMTYFLRRKKAGK